MKSALLVVAATLLTCSPLQAADRLTDRDVKALVARIEEGRDRFDDALDGKLKHSIVRGPSGEVKVDDFLNDFQKNIDRLEERLKPEYAASAEAATLLRQASTIDRFFRTQPPGTKGESEWNRLATDLKTLAVAYGADFPLAEGAPVRRMGDREVAAGLEEVAKGAERLKKSLDNELKKDSTIDKGRRESIVDEADQLMKDAKVLRERVKDGDPTSAEAERLLARASAVQTTLDPLRTAASKSIWSGLVPRFHDLAGAYFTSWPANR
jgi:hypothetical protein